MTSRSPNLNRIIQEMAMDMATGRFELQSVTHIMGKSNVWPDALSRLRAPSPAKLPKELEGVPRKAVMREASFWRTHVGY
eukprot:4722878-Amphidinium_carterae.1